MILFHYLFSFCNIFKCEIKNKWKFIQNSLYYLGNMLWFKWMVNAKYIVWNVGEIWTLDLSVFSRLSGHNSSHSKFQLTHLVRLYQVITVNLETIKRFIKIARIRISFFNQLTKMYFPTWSIKCWDKKAKKLQPLLTLQLQSPS